MNRGYTWLVVVLLLAAGAGVWIVTNKPELLPLPVVEIIARGKNVAMSGDQSASGASQTWTMLSGSVVDTGIASDTGSIDDTELPLDQEPTTESGASDPEVEEIINLLEELIAESE